MEDLLIVATGKTSKSTLVINVAVTNTGDRNVLLFNGLYDEIKGGKFHVNTRLAYVVFEKDRIVVGRWAPKVPHDLLVEIPYVPLATLLRHGESAKFVLALKVPLEAYEEYAIPRTTVKEKRPAKNLFLRLGYAVATNEAVPLLRREKTNAGEFLNLQSLDIEDQKIMEIQIEVQQES